MEKKVKATKAKKAPTALELANEAQENKVWEKKNRVYKLKGKHAHSPWVLLQSADKPTRDGKNRLLYFDKEKGYNRALRYVVNHPSPFLDDQQEYKGTLTPSHVVFERGVLGVDSYDIALQKFLDYHPWNEKNGGKGPVVFYEHDPAAIAKKEVDFMMLQAKAMSAALEADLATTEAILRPTMGSSVHSKKTEELTRELMRYAQTKPVQFLEDIENDLLLIRNAAYTAIDFGICKLTDNGTVLKWTENGQRILSIPFGENPYSFIGDWFSTDEGLEYLNKITQKLKKK